MESKTILECPHCGQIYSHSFECALFKTLDIKTHEEPTEKDWKHYGDHLAERDPELLLSKIAELEAYQEKQNAFIDKCGQDIGRMEKAIESWKREEVLWSEEFKDKYEKIRALRSALTQVLPYLRAAGTNGNAWVPVVEKVLHETQDKDIESFLKEVKSTI